MVQKIRGIAGKRIVLTGSLEVSKLTQVAFKAMVKASGGTLAGAVDEITDFLVEGKSKDGKDSTKTTKAKEQGVTIYPEREFWSKFEAYESDAEEEAAVDEEETPKKSKKATKTLAPKKKKKKAESSDEEEDEDPDDYVPEKKAKKKPKTK